MLSGPAQLIIDNLENKSKHLNFFLKKYPNLYVEETWNGFRYFTKDVNKNVTHLEKISDGGYLFYLMDGEQKIYSNPIGVNACTEEFIFEMDWLPEVVEDEINPKVLVDLMIQIKSQYISDILYHKKMPYLKDWLDKY